METLFLQLLGIVKRVKVSEFENIRATGKIATTLKRRRTNWCKENNRRQSNRKRHHQGRWLGLQKKKE